MSTKRIVQVIAVLFLLTSVALSIPNTEWNKGTSVYAFVTLVLGTVGSIISIFIPTSYTYPFDLQNWTSIAENEYKISISKKHHGMGGSPKCEAFMLKDVTYEVVGVHFTQDDKGNISMYASMPFKGKLVIS